MKIKKDLHAFILSVLTKVLPKYKRAMIMGYPNIEGSAVAVANFIATNSGLPVIYVISTKYKDNPEKLLHTNIEVLDSSGVGFKKYLYMYKVLTSKYVFLTHSLFLIPSSKRQIVINIWHGLLYKKVGKLVGSEISMRSDLTVGTSELSKKMFSQAFDVSEESVIISGYPRNDILIRSKSDKVNIKHKIDPLLNTFNKVVIWLPTYRGNSYNSAKTDGSEVGNPFYIENFDVESFNEILKKNNAICFVKPHPLAIKYATFEFSNITFIDDLWLSDNGITLYHLAGCSDLLISDVSSIIIDYLLTDNPIACISTDFEEYRNSRGFYFDDIENWLPNLLPNQVSFFQYVNSILNNDIDPYENKRKLLRDKFFSFSDEFSTKRLVEYVLKFKK